MIDVGYSMKRYSNWDPPYSICGSWIVSGSNYLFISFKQQRASVWKGCIGWDLVETHQIGVPKRRKGISSQIVLGDRRRTKWFFDDEKYCFIEKL